MLFQVAAYLFVFISFRSTGVINEIAEFSGCAVIFMDRYDFDVFKILSEAGKTFMELIDLLFQFLKVRKPPVIVIVFFKRLRVFKNTAQGAVIDLHGRFQILKEDLP